MNALSPTSTSPILTKDKPWAMSNGLLVVCAWCYPRETIHPLVPHLRFRDGTWPRISHGICAEHKAEVLSKVKVAS